MAIPFIHVQARGGYRDLGRAVGEAARQQVQASVDFFSAHFAAMTQGRLSFSQATALADAYAGHARRWLPQYVDELEGVAEGARVPFTDLMVLNCAEEFTSVEPVSGDELRTADVSAPSLEATPPGGSRGASRPTAGARPGEDRCTAVAVAAGGRHVMGHNMDWYVVDAVNNVLFDLTVPDGTRIMGIAGAPYLLMLGMTSHGVGNVSNSVHSNDNRVGVPNTFVRRWSLEAAGLEEARARGLLAARARGTNHCLADTRGSLWDVETSATAWAFTDHSAAGFVAHTNHYAASTMFGYEGAAHEESRVRLATAERLLSDGLARGDDPLELVARVLRCHEPSPEQAICGHADTTVPAAEQGMTVSSMICDLDERRLHVCAGPPCENDYQVFSM